MAHLQFEERAGDSAGHARFEHANRLRRVLVRQEYLDVRPQPGGLVVGQWLGRRFIEP